MAPRVAGSVWSQFLELPWAHRDLDSLPAAK